jgi:hypothetical protein
MDHGRLVVGEDLPSKWRHQPRVVGQAVVHQILRDLGPTRNVGPTAAAVPASERGSTAPAPQLRRRSIEM